MDNYNWSEGSKPPLEYLKEFKKPEMVKMAFEGDQLDIGELVDTTKPFLLYSHRRRTKVYADMEHLDATTTTYVKDGPTVEIPKDYLGKIFFFLQLGGLAAAGWSNGKDIRLLVGG